MARPPTAREHYDTEIGRLTVIVRSVNADELRGERWKEETLAALRHVRELLSQSPPKDVKKTSDPSNARRGDSAAKR